MTNERIDSAIEVINYAISNNISVASASVKSGYAVSYVKNVKRDIISKYESGIIDDELYDKFMSSYEEYEKVVNSHKPNIQPQGEQLKYDVDDNGNVNITWENGGLNQDTFYPPNHIKTVEQLLDRCKVDLDKYRITRHVVNKWDVTGFVGQGDDKRPLTWENFQVKATLELKQELKKAKELSEIFNELINDVQVPTISPKLVESNNVNVDENNLLEISLFDLHMGKLGWAGEVGENFDTKIAYQRFIDSINNLLQRSQGINYSRILFPIGNDFFNSDNLNNTTTAGTPQDEDLRWQKTFKLGCKLIIDAINILKLKNVPIDIVVIPGNHDFERSYYLGTVIDAWFRNDSQINVDNRATPRKYYNFGNVLIGLTHGKEEKENSLPMLMASEKPELWGNSKFREWHLGHYHKKRNLNYVIFDKGQVLNEEHGVIVRYLSSLTGTEEWHFKKGFVSAAKAGEAFIWNDSTGLIAHLNFNFTKFNKEE